MAPDAQSNGNRFKGRISRTALETAGVTLLGAAGMGIFALIRMHETTQLLIRDVAEIHEELKYRRRIVGQLNDQIYAMRVDLYRLYSREGLTPTMPEREGSIDHKPEK